MCSKQEQTQARKEEYKRIAETLRGKIRKIKTQVKLKTISLNWALRMNCKWKMWGWWCMRGNTAWIVWKRLKYSGPFLPSSSQAEHSPWCLHVPEEFEKEPVLGEQVRSYFVWTHSSSWDWLKGAEKAGCCSCLASCCDCKAPVYCLWKIMMNRKSKHYSHIQEWQKRGSGMLSVAASPQSLQR